jgi:hypothetical protein
MGVYRISSSIFIDEKNDAFLIITLEAMGKHISNQTLGS